MLWVTLIPRIRIFRIILESYETIGRERTREDMGEGGTRHGDGEFASDKGTHITEPATG